MIYIRICVFTIVSDVHGRTVAWSAQQVGYGGLELGLSLHSACRSLDFCAPKDRNQPVRPKMVLPPPPSGPFGTDAKSQPHHVMGGP
jgi:hypothetical protein